MYLNPVRYVLVILNHFNFNNFKTHYTKDLDFKKSVRVSKRKLTITFGCFYFRMFPVQAGRECRRIGFFFSSAGRHEVGDTREPTAASSIYFKRRGGVGDPATTFASLGPRFVLDRA